MVFDREMLAGKGVNKKRCRFLGPAVIVLRMILEKISYMLFK